MATKLEPHIHKRIEWRVKRFRDLVEFSEVMASQQFHFTTDEYKNGDAYVASLLWKLFVTYKDEAFVVWYGPAISGAIKKTFPFTISYECRATVEMKAGMIPTEYKNTSGLTFTAENQGSFPKTCFFIIGKPMIPHLSTRVEDETITINFMVDIYSKADTNSRCVRASISTGKDKLKAWNLQLLMSGDHADVKIISMEGKEFPAHKLILSRIPGFAHKFGRQTEDMKNGIVRLTDLSSASVEFLLQYIYSDEIPPFKEASVRTVAEGRIDYDDTPVATGPLINSTEALYIAQKFALVDLCDHVRQVLRTRAAIAHAKWWNMIQNNPSEYARYKRQIEWGNRRQARYFESDYDFDNPS